MFYFGPWDEAGHYLFDEQGYGVRTKDRGAFPWDEYSGESGIDGVLQPGCFRKFDRWMHGDQLEGQALLHHRSGWTALSFWDRSVDKRGNCNSTYFAEGTFTFDEMVAMAKERFAYRWNKMPFQVVNVTPAAVAATL
jgi:hypothetical protein